MSQHKNKEPNRLIHTGSPYLLQHAYNPVDWYPWGEEALQKAKNEDKPILVSIGYSACHWCHVMERESFENEEIAQVMNEHFVCIKVDREERPDIDAIYMDAVQAMGLQGGWPLNAFLNPQAKPFYAGTYFPPSNWFQLLLNINKIFHQNRKELDESAEQFRQSIALSEVRKYGLNEIYSEFTREDLHLMFKSLERNFDKERGGMQKAPKFPMPCIYGFLLYYAQLPGLAPEIKKKTLAQLTLTLDQMAGGGIYDQLGGGFARYSVDGDWFAPHFEKMLYDNGQLISLYAQAYNFTKNPNYKEIVYQCIAFVKRELRDENGGFYSALDADSEGVEGKYYVWTYEELAQIFTDPAELQLFCEFYGASREGNWEHGYNILCLKEKKAEFCENRRLDSSAFDRQLADWHKKLLDVRQKRIRPGLDNKVLTSWNALVIIGLIDAYRVFDEPEFLELALSNAQFIREKLSSKTDQGYRLFRNFQNGKAMLDAYLEDYALLIEAYTALFEVDAGFEWLEEANELAGYVLQNFYDPEEKMFYFTDSQSEQLIARKKEIFDNVIPASNSVMAMALYRLGIITGNPEYVQTAKQMTGKMRKLMLQNVEYLANWAQLYVMLSYPTAEVVIVGGEAKTFRAELDKHFYPNKVFVTSAIESQKLPLLENRGLIQQQTAIYVCFNHSCQLPVTEAGKAWEILSKVI